MMKHIQYLAFVAVATIALASCRQEEKPSVTPTPEGPYTYVLAIDGATKAVFEEDHMAWEEGDLIGWYTDKAGSSEVDMNTDPRSFVVSSTDPLAAGSTVYAYAPYQGGELDITAAPFSIPVTQDGSTISSCMPLAAIPVKINDNLESGADTPVETAQFINLGALIRYNVYSSNTEYAAEAVESVTFAANSPIAGEFTLDLTALDINVVEQGKVPAPSTLTETTVISALSTAAVAGGSKENGVKLYQVIAPGSFSGTITVTTDKAMYTYTLASALDFERGHLQPFNIDLASLNATRVDAHESLLAGKVWKITAFGEYYDAKDPNATGSSLYADDTITFNADHTITYSIQNGIFYWDNSATDGYAWTPSGSERWALELKADGLYLTLSGGAIPLMMVSQTDAVNGSFKILSLTEDELSLYMLITEWNNYQTYADFGLAADTSEEEALLTGTTWQISAFGEYYDAKYPDSSGSSLYADDTITFNADHTITYSIQNGIFYWDNSATDGYAWTPSGSERWALELKADGLYLTLSGGAIPLMMVSQTDAVNGSFKILSLTEDLLSLYMLITEWGDYQTYVDFVPATAVE